MKIQLSLCAILTVFLSAATTATAGTILVTPLPSMPCSCSWVLRLVKVPLAPPPTFEETGPVVEPPAPPEIPDDGLTRGGEVTPAVPEPQAEPWNPWWAVKPTPKPPVELYQWVWVWVCVNDDGSDSPPDVVDIGEPPADIGEPPAGTGEPPAGAAVPEPASAALIGLGLVSCSRRWRRK